MFSLNEELFPCFSNFNLISQSPRSYVYSAYHEGMKQQVAIKAFVKSSILASIQKRNFQRELDILETIDHPFIAQFYGLVDDLNAYYIIMEYVQNGTLNNYISKTGRIKETEVQRLFCQIASAVRYLHSKRHIIHRDLELEHIMLDSNFNVRIIDFGIGAFNDNEMMKTQCGVVAFSAPEVIKHKPYNNAVDIWTIGVVLYSMLYGKLPFNSNNLMHLAAQIMENDPEINSTVNYEANNLVMQMLDKNPLTRITIEEIAENHWLQNSRYVYYLSDTFITSSKYIVVPKIPNDIDIDIIKLLIPLKINCEETAHELLENKKSEGTMVYRMLRKEKVISLLASPTEIRAMYNEKRKAESIPPRTTFNAPTQSYVQKTFVPAQRKISSMRNAGQSFVQDNTKMENRMSMVMTRRSATIKPVTVRVNLAPPPF